MDRKRHGFTLVELLVVITIIGMLVALLVPAVISARERARQGVCVNRLKELGTATIHYESVKGQLPRWWNPAPLDQTKTKPVSWIVALFPYLGREDLWKEWRDGAGPQVVYEGVVCPSDMGNLSNDAPMNYVANRELFVDLSANSKTLERLTSVQRTVMLSERAYQDATPVGPWGPWDTNTAEVESTRNQLTFAAPAAPTSFFSLRNNVDGISSNHSGILHIAFADGHVEAVAEDAMTDIYRWIPNP